MGFMLEKYTNNMAGLRVSFLENSNAENYFSGNNAIDALNYFNLYIKDNQIYYRTEEELALSETGISTVTEAEQLRQELNEIISEMTDEEAIERPILFPSWKSGKEYTVNERIRYGGRIFKVLQNHTSQEDWTPSRAPSLFAEILTNETGEPQEWQQPSSTNPYLTGDKVIYNGQIYESLIDNNIWSPVEYPTGWKLIQDGQNSEEQTIPEWQQPDATSAYHIGDRVSYNGKIYESLIDNNIWSPESYPQGWEMISEPDQEPETPIEPEPEPDTPTISDWVQPNATNAYKFGDRVRYNEHIYESTIDDNVWSPDAYPAGWTLIE